METKELISLLEMAEKQYRYWLEQDNGFWSETPETRSNKNYWKDKVDELRHNLDKRLKTL